MAQRKTGESVVIQKVHELFNFTGNRKQRTNWIIQFVDDGYCTFGKYNTQKQALEDVKKYRFQVCLIQNRAINY